MNDDEEFLFEQEMADVKRLQQGGRVKIKRDKLSPDGAQQRRAAAVAEEGDVNPLSDAGIEPLDSWLAKKLPGGYRLDPSGPYYVILNRECFQETKAVRDLDD